ncbi:LAGLIDADG family homing endonuclease [Candidatus Falkowbacteria bacterium]|nr:LAGLIDADG family homing endonuclease [Candidatus Falkowbacteria bacterium]
MRADNQQERLGKLNPWYITGFVEGEGTFHVAFYRDPKTKFGIKIIPEFHVNQSYLRINTLEEIKNYFGCGYIKENNQNKASDTTYVYVVRNRDDLKNKIIPFFEEYPLLSVKQESFEKFSQIVKDMAGGKHKTKEGIKAIIAKAYEMNNKGRYRRIDKNRLFNSLKSSETICQTPPKAEKI